MMQPLFANGRTYKPYSHGDSRMLVSLPNLYHRAGPWTAALLQKTCGTTLALGDVRVLVVQAVGVPNLERVERLAGTVNEGDEAPIEQMCYCI